MRFILILCCVGTCLLTFQTTFAQSDAEAIQQRINTLQAEIDSMKYWTVNQDLASKPTLYWTLNGIIMGGLHAVGGLGGFLQGYAGAAESIQNWDRQPEAGIGFGISMLSIANGGFALYSLTKALDKNFHVIDHTHMRNFWISVGAETVFITTVYTIASIHDHGFVKDKIRKQAEIQLLQEQLKRLNIGFRPNSGGLVLLYHATF